MKIFHSEFNKNYPTYTFSYAIYGIMEKGDKLSYMYEKGFLPYAGESEYNSKKTIKEIFYLCRSIRVNLTKYQLSSENRRILKKAASFQIEMKLIPKQILKNDPKFLSFCYRYANERYKNGSMSKTRFDYVLRRQCGTDIFVFSIENKNVGYVLVGIDDDSVHFWFSFFDTSYLNFFPIGKYIMQMVIDWSTNANKKFVYLGTCYGESALYKTRDFKGMEFFNGSNWNSDMSELKAWCKSDKESLTSDRYKINFTH